MFFCAHLIDFILSCSFTCPKGYNVLCLIFISTLSCVKLLQDISSASPKNLEKFEHLQEVFQTSHLTRGLVDPEASLILLHSPSNFGLSVYQLLARLQKLGCCRFLEHDLRKKVLQGAILMCFINFITYTELIFTYGSDTSGWELGNGERGQNTLRGRVNFSEVGDVIPPERIGTSLLGFRS